MGRFLICILVVIFGLVLLHTVECKHTQRKLAFSRQHGQRHQRHHHQVEHEQHQQHKQKHKVSHHSKSHSHMTPVVKSRPKKVDTEIAKVHKGPFYDRLKAMKSLKYLTNIRMKRDPKTGDGLAVISCEGLLLEVHYHFKSGFGYDADDRRALKFIDIRNLHKPKGHLVSRDELEFDDALKIYFSVLNDGRANYKLSDKISAIDVWPSTSHGITYDLIKSEKYFASGMDADLVTVEVSPGSHYEREEDYEQEPSEQPLAVAVPVAKNNSTATFNANANVTAAVAVADKK